MTETIDGFRYISYLASRWRTGALSCLIAITVAAAVSLIVPREFTATARIVIEPPAGADVRAASIAVSPIYFESLRTYESFAASDTLFQRAMSQSDLRSIVGSRSIESIKKRVLKVGIVHNTRILEISATLPDPRKAQALAQFIAESTTALNRSVANESGRDLIDGLEAEARQARDELQRADARWTELLAAEPLAGLQAAAVSSADLRAKLEEQASGLRLEVADSAGREKQAAAPELPQIRAEQAEAATRLSEIQMQLKTLDAQDREREKLLAARMAHRDSFEPERKARQAALSAIENRLSQARADAGYRGESLRIIDPGIVPERPSSPNIPLNIAAALLLGVTLPALYFAIEINFQEMRIRARREMRAPARNG